MSNQKEKGSRLARLRAIIANLKLKMQRYEREYRAAWLAKTELRASGPSVSVMPFALSDGQYLRAMVQRPALLADIVREALGPEAAIPDIPWSGFESYRIDADSEGIEAAIGGALKRSGSLLCLAAAQESLLKSDLLTHDLLDDEDGACTRVANVFVGDFGGTIAAICGDTPIRIEGASVMHQQGADTGLRPSIFMSMYGSGSMVFLKLPSIAA